MTLLVERMKDFENLELKIGIDGGGGFLKVCLNIIANENENVPPTKNTAKCPENFLNTVVNKSY